MPLTPKRVGSVAYSLVMFVLVSVLAGVLVAGLFVPAAGMAGVGARTGAQQLENLPAELTTPDQAERSKVLLADGSTLANFYDENRVYISLKDIAPVMRQAQIAIEDHRFYQHGAIDLVGTLRAFLHNQTGGSTAGGSSITQQYVKMVLVEQAVAKGDKKGIAAAQAQSYTRKIQELRYAIALERKYTKDQILERYLNIAYYGDGAYGVEAAAHHYFNKSASKLTLPEAAMLAGIVQNPDQVNPVSNLRAATDRRDVVLNRLVTLNVVSKKDGDKAKKVKFQTGDMTSVNNGCQGTRYPFLCDYVRQTLLADPALGKTKEDRQNILNRGGLTIKTEIDPKTQDQAETKIAAKIDPRDPVISVMTMVQPGTGLILAMAQSRPVMGKDKKAGETYYNYASSQQGFQAGSTFKAFTAAAAFSQGIPIATKFNARSPLPLTDSQWDGCAGTYTQKTPYNPKNAVGHSKTIDMQEAANFSVNTYFLQLEQKAGLCNTVNMAKNLGVQLGAGSRSWNEYGSSVPSFTLGVAEVTPLSMAEAYATFAARGKYCEPHIVAGVTGADGKDIKIKTGQCKQVIKPEVADAVNLLLSGVPRDGTARNYAQLNNLAYNQAGKTGTIEGNKAVWFAGYTPAVAGVAMIAADSQRELSKSGLKHKTLPYSGTYLYGSGSQDAGAWIYKPTMEEAMKNLPKDDFVAPPTELVEGKKVDVPSTIGLTPLEVRNALRDAHLTARDTYEYSDYYPAGSFMGVSPDSFTSVREYSVVDLRFSKGVDPAIARQRQQDAQRQAQAQRNQQQQGNGGGTSSGGTNGGGTNGGGTSSGGTNGGGTNGGGTNGGGTTAGGTTGGGKPGKQGGKPSKPPKR